MVILGSLLLVVAFSYGLRYMRITTDPVELWSSPASQARQEKDYFDSHFGPFFRTAQLIITTSTKNNFTYSPYFGGSNVPFKPIFDKELLHQVSLPNTFTPNHLLIYFKRIPCWFLVMIMMLLAKIK